MVADVTPETDIIHNIKTISYHTLLYVEHVKCSLMIMSGASLLLPAIPQIEKSIFVLFVMCVIA